MRLVGRTSRRGGKFREVHGITRLHAAAMDLHPSRLAVAFVLLAGCGAQDPASFADSSDAGDASHATADIAAVDAPTGQAPDAELDVTLSDSGGPDVDVEAATPDAAETDLDATSCGGLGAPTYQKSCYSTNVLSDALESCIDVITLPELAAALPCPSSGPGGGEKLTACPAGRVGGCRHALVCGSATHWWYPPWTASSVAAGCSGDFVPVSVVDAGPDGSTDAVSVDTGSGDSSADGGAAIDSSSVESGVDDGSAGDSAAPVGCDPRNPGASCGSGKGCVFDGAGTMCASAGTGTTAGGCVGSASACAPQYVCVGSDCMRWCRVGFPGDCTAGKSCLSLPSHPKYGGIEYGVCAY